MEISIDSAADIQDYDDDVSEGAVFRGPNPGSRAFIVDARALARVTTRFVVIVPDDFVMPTKQSEREEFLRDSVLHGNARAGIPAPKSTFPAATCGIQSTKILEYEAAEASSIN